MHIKTFKNRVMMLEVWNPIEEVMNYYRNVSDFPFNFRFLTTMNSNSNGRDAENAIRGWVDNIPDNGWPNWVVRVSIMFLLLRKFYLHISFEYYVEPEKKIGLFSFVILFNLRNFSPRKERKAFYPQS
jgi:hypothetical protein